VLLDAFDQEMLRLTALLVADGELMTTLRAAGSQDTTAILGGHAGPKTMLICALAAAGLKCTLHCKTSSLYLQIRARVTPEMRGMVR
jgi:hypothetical protein